MHSHEWYIVIGVLMTSFAVVVPRIGRLPVTSSLLYLIAGICLGPLALGLLAPDPVADSTFVEHFAEVAVIVSLFAAGLKLQLPLHRARWWLPVRLAFGGMALTVGMVALAGVYLLGLSWGAAVLLGAVLAPTDPVLASQVELRDPDDKDKLRFSLTGEAALNDGTAFPFVMLGVGLLGLHEIGPSGLRWLGVDLIWAILGGLGVGVAIGVAAGFAVVALAARSGKPRRAALDDFLALGLLATTYGLALAIETYGFLAATALGLALRRAEHAARRRRGDELPDDEATRAAMAVAVFEDDPSEELPNDAECVETFVSATLLDFNEQLERFLEVGVVVLLGAALTSPYLTLDALWFAPLLFLVIRPLAVLVSLLGTQLRPWQRPLIAWFGIRGIGSIYYLTHGIGFGVERETATTLTAITLGTVALSILVHGITAKPLMRRYERRIEADSEAQDEAKA